MKAVCPYCEKLTEVRVATAQDDYTIRGQKIAVAAERSICTTCGNEFATAEQMRKALLDGYAKYRTLNDIVAPGEIVRIRAKYGISQKTFAKILDLGELTINSYEQGSLPSKANSNLIRLMDDPINFLKMFRENRRKLSARQVCKIEEKIKGDVPLSQGVRYHQEPPIVRPENISGTLTGYRRPDPEKLLLVAGLVVFHSGRQLYKMALLKILFYVDFVASKKLTVSVTGWPYARLPLGPVPENYKQLLAYGEQEGYLEITPTDDELGELCGLPGSFRRTEAESHFSPNELTIVEEVVAKLKDKTATELKNLTHQERAWKETAPSALISYSYAADLVLF